MKSEFHKFFLHRLIYYAFVEIRSTQDYKIIWTLSNVLHNVPLELNYCTDNQSYNELYIKVKKNMEQNKLSKWFNFHEEKSKEIFKERNTTNNQ